MPTRDEIHQMAHLLRAAHCTLDRLATDHLQKGERETVEAFCQTLRNCYQDVFERLPSGMKEINHA